MNESDYKIIVVGDDPSLFLVRNFASNSSNVFGIVELYDTSEDFRFHPKNDMHSGPLHKGGIEALIDLLGDQIKCFIVAPGSEDLIPYVLESGYDENKVLRMGYAKTDLINLLSDDFRFQIKNYTA